VFEGNKTKKASSAKTERNEAEVIEFRSLVRSVVIELDLSSFVSSLSLFRLPLFFVPVQ